MGKLKTDKNARQKYLEVLNGKIQKLNDEIENLYDVRNEYLRGEKFKDSDAVTIDLEAFSNSLAKFLLRDPLGYRIKPRGALDTGHFLQYFYNQKANRVMREIELKENKLTHIVDEINKIKKIDKNI